MSRRSTRSFLIALAVVAVQFISMTTVAQQKSTSQPFSGYFYVQPNAGISQYYGDLNSKDLWNGDPRFAFGALAGYQISPIFGIRGQFVKTNLYSERSSRDEKFSSDLWDAALNLTFNINEIFADYNDRRFANFYLFTGGGLTSYKSKIEKLSTGTVIQEQTERQSEFFVPVGGGVSLRLSDALAVNMEYSDHITFKGDGLDMTPAGKKNDHYSYASVGLQIRFGHKDTDKDGIIDKNDACPSIPGKIELLGCPDKDNDGVTDSKDDCPDYAGKAEFKGCPDMDNDQIPDKDDACPDVAGLKELKGCPDADGDGITDKEDVCPDLAGRPEFKGCPDKDGDGIPDNKDECPDVRGRDKFNGCPDRDSDEVPDKLDNCPDIPGLIENKGCPAELKGAVLRKTVYFNSDESVVLAEYILEMNDVAAYMNENPEATLVVAGHTDSRESDEYNMRLSEKRAAYVIEYLESKGMVAAKVKKTYYGKTMPVADNNTVDGRALNRRVEIEIIK
jgi:OmpA-OmpF porin, OOP family